ncbi:hypothetical protein T08_13660 [Trichinella sp. T8]|nr:hypothetical protein T08_13660 [Trichinella sp. T8]
MHYNSYYTSVVVCRFAFRPTFARVVSFRSRQMWFIRIASFIGRVSFVNNGWRELKETIEQLKIRVYQSQTTRANVGRNAKRHTTTLVSKKSNVKSRNSKQQIHRKHCLWKNKNNQHVNGKNVKMSCNNTKRGSSECTVILSVMYHSKVSGRSDLRALLIAGFIRRVSFVNNGWRELKETPSSNWKIPCQAIMFGRKETTRANVGRNAKRRTTTLV